MTQTTEQRVFGLDLLRAVAILCVFISHIAPFYENRSARVEASVLYFGYFGVEAFFVLSGYLIARIVIRSLSADRSWKALRSFWIRRWFRTIPTYFLFLGLSAALAIYFSQPLGEFWRYFIFLQHTLASTSFFGESWSLVVEEWFYVLFPLLMWVLARRTNADIPRTFFLSLGIFLAATVTLRCLLVFLFEPAWDAQVRRTLLYRLDAPGYGVLAAGISIYFPDFWTRYRRQMSALGMLLFFLSFSIFFSTDERWLNSSHFARTGYFIITSLSVLCVLPALSEWKSASGALAKGITWISLWSYSLYLCQLPVRSLLLHWIGIGHLGSTMYLCGSLLVAALCYRFFERPMTALRERFS